MATSDVTALLFDFDGLLIDTETPSFRAWQDTYREHGQELALERWATCLGTIGGFDPFADLVSLTGLALDGEVVRRRYERKMQLVLDEPLRPGIVAYLADIDARGLRRGIVTSSGRAWVDQHLERVGATDGWATIRCADGDPSIAKPSPALYLSALADLGSSPREVLVLEDSPNGISAAKRAGLFCIAVPNPVTAQLDLSQADVVVESLADLPLEDLLANVPVSDRR